MGKITEALKKAAQEKLARIERLEKKAEVKFEFIARKIVNSKVDPRIVSFHDPSSSIAEQYRTLRTNIQAISSKKPIKTITVTSSIHGEGKTISSVNLAISMAHDLNKRKILLVDADLRRPKISKYLGLNSELGLSDLISNGLNVSEALINIDVNNLTVLPAGKIPPNPAELLGSIKMRNIIGALKKKFDYVIFDTPPIITVTDAGILGAETDGVIIAVQADRTQRGIVQHSETLLKQVDAKILGYILTNVQYHIPAYIYRYL